MLQVCKYLSLGTLTKVSFVSLSTAGGASELSPSHVPQHFRHRVNQDVCITQTDFLHSKLTSDFPQAKRMEADGESSSLVKTFSCPLSGPFSLQGWLLAEGVWIFVEWGHDQA